MQSRIILLFIAVFAVSWASIFVRLSEAPALACALWRMAFSVLIVLCVYRLNVIDALRRLSLCDYLKLLIPSVALALHFGLWMESLFLTSIAVSTTIVCTHPIFSALTVYLALGEKPNIKQILGFIMALTGIYILYSIDTGYYGIQHGLGVLLALGGAITGGIYFAYGRILRRYIPLPTYTFTVYSISAIVLLLLSLIYGVPVIGYPLKSWIFFVLLALVPMMLGHTILNYLLKYFKVFSVTSAVLGEPVGATLLAIVIFNEVPALVTYIGMVVVLTGIALVLTSKD